MAELVLAQVSADVSDLRDRLLRTRWSPRWPLEGWSAGTDQDELRRLVAYWADGFDWESKRQAIEALPWHTESIGRTPLRFLRFDAEMPDALLRDQAAARSLATSARSRHRHPGLQDRTGVL